MKIVIEKQEKYFLYYHGFGFLWNTAMILSMSNFVITSATCIWYHNNHEDGGHPISKSFFMAFRYHFGTLAFGSFILAVVWVLRIIAEYVNVTLFFLTLRKKLKSMTPTTQSNS
jgi:hypothetical protein